MRIPHRLALVLACSLSVSAFGCSHSDSPAAPPPAAAAPIVGAATPKSESLAAGRALIVTQEVRITVHDVDAAAARIRADVDGAGGYVADGGTSGKGDDRVAHLTLKVPVARLGDLRAALAGVGEVTSSSEKVQDVTEERADLDARLHNARVQEKRIVDIMSAKTGTIAEVIDAERELARVRESIERLEAQKRALDGRIDFATIDVWLKAPGAVVWQSPGTSIAEAGRSGMRAAAAFFTYAAMAFMMCAPTVAPFALLGGAIFVVVRRRRQRDLAVLR